MKAKAQSFEFTSYNLDLNNQKATFKYTVHITDSEKIEFAETLLFPEKFVSEDTLSHDLIYACLYNVHLILGISYWKMHLAPTIHVAEIPLSKEQAEFWNIVYTKGLGEFFYKNNIDFRNLIQFPAGQGVSASSFKSEMSDKVLVGIGGGKDSIVAIEKLKKQKQTAAGFVLEGTQSSGIIDEVAKLARIPVVTVQRQIDPKLIELNESGHVYNGHIPISAIYAFVGILTAALYRYNAVIVGNEQSADIGNVTYLKESINHQWSKSSEFEVLFQKYVKEYITPSIGYRSVLRTQSELSVIKTFSQYEKYFPVFSSCNRNFSLTKKSKKRWCGECPKCAFVFAGLAAFLRKKTVISIFNKNLFADAELISLYRELSGLKDTKPFECVGTFEETILALYMAHEKNEYTGDPIMNMFDKEILPAIVDIDKLRNQIITSA